MAIFTSRSSRRNRGLHKRHGRRRLAPRIAHYDYARHRGAGSKRHEPTRHTNAELDIGEYTPRAIKKAVVGNGSADKEQIQQMMKLLLKLDFDLQSDEADGLAIALCHANHMHVRSLGIASKVRGGRWR